MKKTLLYALSALILTFAAASCRQSDQYIALSGYAQGGVYSVKINMKGVKQRPEQVRDSVDKILSQVDFSLSGYNKSSLLSRFNAGETIFPDSIFIDIYNLSYKIYEQTQGGVDVSSAPLFDVWGFGFKSGQLPDDEAVLEAMKVSGMGRLCSDMRKCLGPDGSLSAASLLKESSDNLPQLNYNAIAQGYSCDIVADYLRSIGVKDMMVDIGEIYCEGVNPKGLQWTVGIDRPQDGNDVPGADLQAIFKVPSGPKGVVTSGNYRKFYQKNGKKYAHTIDPRTGRPVDHNLLSATVLASDATLADAYATYCMVLGLEEAREFISSNDDLEACLIYDDNGTFAVWTSDGFLLEEADR